jgi:hypothetical protein
MSAAKKIIVGIALVSFFHSRFNIKAPALERDFLAHSAAACRQLARARSLETNDYVCEPRFTPLSESMRAVLLLEDSLRPGRMHT